MSKIEWTEKTWNPTTGCDRVSEGCANCYAATMAVRLKGTRNPKYQRDGRQGTSGPGFALSVHPDTLDLPRHWRKPRVVFVNSMSDLFHPEVPEEFIALVWDVMAEEQRHTYQILTKRPQRMAAVAPSPPLPNVWLGTSIESDRYCWRAEHVRRTPAAIRFLSLEPLLGPLPSLDLSGIDWVIVGAESGRGARPMDERWVRDIRDRCVSARIPFFSKAERHPGRAEGISTRAGRTQVGQVAPLRE